MPRILLFYSRTGAGHFRVAQTLADELNRETYDCHVELCDGLAQTGLGWRMDPSATFTLLSTRLLPAFNAGYRLTDTRNGVPALRQLIRRIWGKALSHTVAQVQPDAIVSTHHFISPSTLRLPPKVPFITVVTDIGRPHRLWYDARADAVIVPYEEMMAEARQALDLWRPAGNGRVSQLVTFGFPLDPAFRHVANHPFPTRKLLVMGGGCGTGAMERQVIQLAGRFPGHLITAICGWNHQLQRRLSDLHLPNVRTLGFVSNPQDYMAESDLVVTKAGPSTILEAAALRKPLIITSWVGIQERMNVDFVTRHKLGVYCPRPGELPECVTFVYERYAEFTGHAIAALVDGARPIAEFVTALAATGSGAAPHMVAMPAPPAAATRRPRS